MQATGRPKSENTIRREIRRVMNANAAALAEKTLAKALQGDSHAMLAASQLLAFGLGKENPQ